MLGVLSLASPSPLPSPAQVSDSHPTSISEGPGHEEACATTSSKPSPSKSAVASWPRSDGDDKAGPEPMRETAQPRPRPLWRNRSTTVLASAHCTIAAADVTGSSRGETWLVLGRACQLTLPASGTTSRAAAAMAATPRARAALIPAEPTLPPAHPAHPSRCLGKARTDSAVARPAARRPCAIGGLLGSRSAVGRARQAPGVAPFAELASHHVSAGSPRPSSPLGDSATASAVARRVLLSPAWRIPARIEEAGK
mmetsp:Transcript_26529/g.99812  ORF Transcript_26529/g.99812 Transcript_26529/m.99812 type:complete len:254 (+) Transcript_26529:3659-4420(+)